MVRIIICPEFSGMTYPRIEEEMIMCIEECESKDRDRIESWWKALQQLSIDLGGNYLAARALNEKDLQTPEQRWDKFGSLMITKIHENRY